MKITKTRMNRYYLWFLKYFNKRDKTYLMGGLNKFDPIYLYGNRYYPLGIIVGRELIIDNKPFFNLEYIRVRKKKEHIASNFLKDLIKKYKIRSINYLSGSIEGKIFFKKMQDYFKENKIEDLSLEHGKSI